eukprot:gene13413-15849_t
MGSGLGRLCKRRQKDEVVRTKKSYFSSSTRTKQAFEGNDNIERQSGNAVSGVGGSQKKIVLSIENEGHANGMESAGLLEGGLERSEQRRPERAALAESDKPHAEESAGGDAEANAVSGTLRRKHAPNAGNGQDLDDKATGHKPENETVLQTAQGRQEKPYQSRPSRNFDFASDGPSMPQKDRWTKGDNIGSGSFGCVYLGLNSETGELLAVKEVNMQSDAAKMAESVEQLEQEVELLAALQHPNIVRYVGTLREKKALFIFLEYVPGGSIASLLARFGSFDESVVRLYTKQILEGLHYLHDQRTVRLSLVPPFVLFRALIAMPEQQGRQADVGCGGHSSFYELALRADLVAVAFPFE